MAMWLRNSPRRKEEDELRGKEEDELHEQDERDERDEHEAHLAFTSEPRAYRIWNVEALGGNCLTKAKGA